MPRLMEVDDSDDDSDDDDNKKGNKEAPAESAEAELSMCSTSVKKFELTMKLECLLKDWNSPIYAFFTPTPLIKYINGHHVQCSAKHCRGKSNGHLVHCYLDKSDAKSTSNLCKHAKIHMLGRCQSGGGWQNMRCPCCSWGTGTN